MAEIGTDAETVKYWEGITSEIMVDFLVLKNRTYEAIILQKH